MWDRNYFTPDMAYAMRLVRTGNATIEEAAQICGVSVPRLQELLAIAASCPQLQLQEVEFSPR